MASRIWYTLFCYCSIWLLVITPASCGSIAAWWNGRGPNIILQDDDTGGIRYSMCNGNYTPVLPDDSTLTAPLTTHPPKRNTSLAATGWTDGTTAWASIFYLDDDDAIVNSLLRCDWGTGRWMNNGDYVISGGAPKVAPTSGLSAVLLGTTDGYRVFYNDLGGTMHHVGYTSDTRAWGYYGVVSRDTASSQAIGSTFYAQNGRLNITVVRPRDAQNLGEARLNADNLWHLSSFPEPLTQSGNQSTNTTAQADLVLDTSVAANFSLPAWSGNPLSVGVGIDSSLTRYVFYIGNDSQLYQLYNGGAGGYWAESQRGDNASWPRADVAGGPLAIASDAGTQAIRLYYASGGRVVEVASNDGRWAEATAVPSVNTTQESTSSSSSSSAAAAAATSASGLSGGAKAGVSAGVTIGVIAIGGMIAAVLLLRRRQRRGIDASADASNPGQDQYYSSTTQHATAYSSNQPDGYAPFYGNAQQQQQPMTYAVDPNSGYVYPPAHQHQHQDGGWVYDANVAAATAGGVRGGGDQGYQMQQYGHPPYQNPNPNPQEMPVQTRPVEMMGEGHYKEAP
ncbi:hypothetical protein F5X96DRAFT_680480 [Biscogniauxia mediterranea]|nr:hypothetical protein F5X96DRAFT_680480 [Biscogniauxia mediterranea]